MFNNLFYCFLYPNLFSWAENQLSGQEFFEAFLKERRYTSDFVSRASDILWKRELLVDDEELNVVKKRLAELKKVILQ